MSVESNGEVSHQPSGRTDVFLGGLPPRVTEEDVSDALSNIGMPPLKVQYRSESGFGVVQFATLEVARQASQLLREVDYPCIDVSSHLRSQVGDMALGTCSV